MARLPRFVLPGQPQHVIVRGNNRSEIFSTDADYRFYLDKLQQACDTHGVDIHAYVLMTNHVHLFITPREKPAGRAVKIGEIEYSQRFNSFPFESGYALTIQEAEFCLLEFAGDFLQRLFR